MLSSLYAEKAMPKIRKHGGGGGITDKGKYRINSESATQKSSMKIKRQK